MLKKITSIILTCVMVMGNMISTGITANAVTKSELEQKYLEYSGGYMDDIIYGDFNHDGELDAYASMYTEVAFVCEDFVVSVNEGEPSPDHFTTLNVVEHDGVELLIVYYQRGANMYYSSWIEIFIIREDASLMNVFFSNDGSTRYTLETLAYDEYLDYDTYEEDIDITETERSITNEIEKMVYKSGSLVNMRYYINDSSYEHTSIFSYIRDTDTNIMTIAYLTLGDVSGDWNIDSSDASMVLAEYAAKATGKLQNFSVQQEGAADVNYDGVVDSSDASVILSYYAYVATGGEDCLADYLYAKGKS